MATLPLQGWAAAAMLSCGGEAHQEMHAIATPGAHASAAHVHAPLASAVHTDGMQARSDSGDDGHPAAGAGHKCSLCATCSHAVGITATRTAATVGVLPRAGLVEPHVIVLSRSPPLPDKPPRA